MSQNGERDLEGGQDAGIIYAAWLAHENSPTYIVDHPRNQSVSTQNQQLQPSQGESNFGDSSGPLFSMYSKAAEEEDNKMADRWQKDADGILIFVSPPVGFHVSLYIIWNTIDGVILCCSCYVAFRVSPEPDPQQSGYVFILSRKHL